MPDTKHVANISILNMARFGTEMSCFRFMLNSDISLIALFIIHYNVTKKHRGNGGRNDAGIMKDTMQVLCRRERFGTSLPLPQAMSGVFPLVQCHGVALQRQNRLLRANLRGISDKRFFLFRIA